MADKYASDLALVVIAQITQTIGYSCTLSAPLELLQDIMQKFTQEFARDLHCNMEHANRIEPSLRDAQLSMKNLNINIQELLDYIGNVEPVGFTRDVPHFPIRKAINMNFLKPGSAETLTRPVYIFEYLPPMQDPEPRESQSEAQREFFQKQELVSKAEFNVTSSAEKLSTNQVDSSSPNAVINFSSNFLDSDVGRSVREMSSVVMTTGGFISPAIEGKLPEPFIPDIIEKFKGLDAPPPSLIAVSHLEHSEKELITSEKDAVNTRTINSETKNFNHNAVLLISDSADASLLYSSNSLPMSSALTATISKKNRKPKPDLAIEHGQIVKSNISFGKSQEKSQRKALKMFQKLSKSQNDASNSQILNMKKSKKRVNHGNSLSDPSKVNIEKMFKKQNRHKQKSVQLETQTLSDFPIEADMNTENFIAADIPCAEPVVLKQIEIGSQSSVFPVQPGGIQQTQVSLQSKKNASEPERSKLDIFKKISKPRTPRQDGGATQVPPGIGVRVFGSTMPVSTLISLPSGTTITPTPPVGQTPEDANNPNSKINQYGVLGQKLSSPKDDIEMSTINPIKAKKRGRKPGGKNLVKQTHFTSHSLIESSKKEKSTRVGAFKLASSETLVSQNSLSVSMPTEPLNLSSTDQASIEYLPNFHAKKERKKYKLKFDTGLPQNVKDFNNVFSETTSSTVTSSIHLMKQKNEAPCPDSLMTAPNTLSNTSLYPGNQTGMVPLLPLLHFPPRPGLIPSGPGLFPAVTGLVGFGNNNNTVGIAPFIAFPGTEGSVADTVRCPPIKDSADTGNDQLLRRSGQMDLQIDRNYCNVAPLVPDSMKFSELSCGNTDMENTFTPSKFKAKPSVQASGNLGDPIEVSDDSDESIQNRQIVQKKSPLTSPNHAKSSLVQSQHQTFATPSPLCEDKNQMDLRNVLPNTSPSESIKKLKKSVKLNLPDVKNFIQIAPSQSSFPQFNLPNFIGGDKFSLAGGADLIPLARIDCGSAYSSHKVPSSSLTGGVASGVIPILPNHISEDQQFMPTFPNYEDISITPTGALSLDPKVRKHHKKPKKIKEGKIKKKKDKKDKSKRKDRVALASNKSDRKIKGLDKKQKKEKKKDKEKQILIQIPEVDEFSRAPFINNLDYGFTQSVPASTPVLKTSPMSVKPPLSATCAMSPKIQQSPSQIPKLTLKLSGKSTTCPEKEKDTTDAVKVSQPTMFPVENKERERDNSPELARFSPLVTGPPKNKQSDTHLLGISSAGPLLNICSGNSMKVIQEPFPMATRTSQISTSQNSSSSAGWMSNPSNSNVASSTLSASSVLLPQQLMLTSNTTMNNSLSSGGPKSCSLSSPANVPEENSHIAETNRPSSYVDAEGNRIWICPACGKVDDGSAMIGCDGCDAWYHWICVGITFAPKDNDDWFCRVCVTKKRVHVSEKKKRRNKKNFLGLPSLLQGDDIRP
ncbi:transcription initiation factor TFIID subunit 3 isoform X2 [Drosophila biarmipes]|uniref:transcription initiation factor TFIID subunit 3 isoform X2 n=1 Tax=Drosophila biarmipes TaxID=125945 RepID=UPI0021CC8C35|nr:transcription initiation factor TFIID subunit 3 isoform X2 [Drosophila biarmipes]